MYAYACACKSIIPAADRCCMLGQVIVVGEMSTVWEVAELQVYGVLFSEAQTTK